MTMIYSLTMARKIVITSGKGGVGKTTLAVLIARRLAETGKRTLVIDMDLSLNNLDVVSGVEDKINYCLEDVISGKCRVKQALVKVCDNFSVLQSSHSFDNIVSGQNVKLLMDGLNDIFDYIFIDCPAGVDLGFHRAVSCADEAIVVINAYPSSVRDADKVVNLLKSYKLKSVVAIVNRLRKDLVSKGRSMNEYECEEILKVPVIAALEDDDAVLCSDGGKLKGLSKTRSAVNKLVKKIEKKDYVSAVEGLNDKYRKIKGRLSA